MRRRRCMEEREKRATSINDFQFLVMLPVYIHHGSGVHKKHVFCFCYSSQTHNKPSYIGRLREPVLIEMSCWMPTT